MTHEDGTTPLNHLVKVLRLGDPSEYRGHTYISGESLYFPTGRVYGGQVIAQSLIAASKTVSPSRLPHSVHGYFIAAGDIRQDLLFDVETLRDGRSFSARRVNVTQSEGPILTAIASFHVTPTIMLGADKDSAAHDSGKQLVWMKADGVVDVPQVMHRAMLALGCDQVMMEPVLRRAGLSISTPGISYASIDHSMWWYRDVDINQWHLYVQDTPTAAHGRGLGVAKVYTQDGELVAAMAQEAMIRVPQQ